MWVGGVGGAGRLKTAEILLAESCHEQVSFESGFKQRKGRRISETGWKRVPDRNMCSYSTFSGLLTSSVTFRLKT